MGTHESKPNGISYKTAFFGLASAAWLVIFAMSAWTLNAVVELKGEVIKIESRLNMAAKKDSQSTAFNGGWNTYADRQSIQK